MGLFTPHVAPFKPRQVIIKGQAYQIRQAEANRRQISQLLYLEAEDYDGATPWDGEAFKRELAKPNCLYLVCYAGDQLVAAIGMRFGYVQAHITFVAVAPARQGQGVAGCLLRLMIDLAKAAGYKRLTLEVAVDNQRAIAVYRHLGFEDNFKREGYYTHPDGSTMDALEMIMYLGRKKQ
ncbi:MAG: ribosomal protein S18-alanine N-acetyltransferase [Lactobacillus sp.]|jgi:ribosomal-protein-alanine N-acetyltransferase